MDTLASDINVGRIPKVENERFFLVVLGEFNHGKSTFVNALLGEALLPVGITPTTATITTAARIVRAEASVRCWRSVSSRPCWPVTVSRRHAAARRCAAPFPASSAEADLATI